MRATLLRASILALTVLAAPAVILPAGAMAPMPTDQPTKMEDPELERAIAMVWAEQFAEAEPLLHAALKRNPKDPDAWNYLGFTTRKLGKFAEAQEYYFNALRLDPEHLKAMEYLGELYLQTGRTELARDLLDRITVLCKDKETCEERDQLAAAFEKAKLSN
ncbi:tetratricopeptide repeat protein [Thalassobaculum sp. OXR-137]|uniref:tetratricopeptide repeat protein n=1 Tax=Thalassobaculum sp. OXR-137 TaxID=3100173 RepID=UPI002AC9ADEF|nr:tetratricopeptide repeat protein [Thalassobaculum sp. OXR-137]WPZ34985.1 tetratricopeptide repeat protein [Thalassobaculum sp. OXR-137]